VALAAVLVLIRWQVLEQLIKVLLEARMGVRQVITQEEEVVVLVL
jgi:hypothetical protein